MKLAARALIPLLAIAPFLFGCGGSDAPADRAWADPRPGGDPTPGGGPGPAAPAPDGSLHAACVAHVNALRATVGLPALARWTANEACADAQARSDSLSGTPHGAFRDCPGNAQNECPGWRAETGARGIVPGCLDMMWAEGPGGGHYDNMTRPGATMVACGFHTTPDGEVWSVQDFR